MEDPISGNPFNNSLYLNFYFMLLIVDLYMVILYKTIMMLQEGEFAHEQLVEQLLTGVSGAAGNYIHLGRHGDGFSPGLLFQNHQ
jgi:hypothetical protein